MKTLLLGFILFLPIFFVHADTIDRIRIYIEEEDTYIYAWVDYEDEPQDYFQINTNDIGEMYEKISEETGLSEFEVKDLAEVHNRSPYNAYGGLSIDGDTREINKISISDSTDKPEVTVDFSTGEDPTFTVRYNKKHDNMYVKIAEVIRNDHGFNIGMQAVGNLAEFYSDKDPEVGQEDTKEKAQQNSKTETVLETNRREALISQLRLLLLDLIKQLLALQSRQ